MEIQVRINAIAVKLIEKIVLAIHHVGTERPLAIHNGSPDSPWGRCGVVMMHPHGVDPKFCHVGGDFLRLVVAREIAIKTGVHPPNPQTPGVGEEPPVADPHKSICPRKMRWLGGSVGDRWRRIIPRNDEWKPGVVCGK